MSKTVIIKNKKPRFYTMNGVRIAPGVNKLTAENAQLFLEHPHAQIKLKRGFFETEFKIAETVDATATVVEETKKAEGNQPTAAELIEIIENSDNKELLETALNDERVTVKRAAQARLDELAEANEE